MRVLRDAAGEVFVAMVRRVGEGDVRQASTDGCAASTEGAGMDTVGVGLAGLGRIGRMHAGNLAYRCSTARLAAVFDLNVDAAREWGERLRVPWTTSYDELLERCDAVAIATPTSSHAELVVAAARAGRPVFCEKPISSDRASTVEVLDAVAAAGVPLQVGFHRRVDPGGGVGGGGVTPPGGGGRVCPAPRGRT